MFKSKLALVLSSIFKMDIGYLVDGERTIDVAYVMLLHENIILKPFPRQDFWNLLIFFFLQVNIQKTGKVPAAVDSGKLELIQWIGKTWLYVQPK